MSFPALFKAITKDQASKQRWVYGMPTLTNTGNYFMFPGKDPYYTIQFRPETLCQFVGVHARPLPHPDDFDEIDDPDEVAPVPLYLGDIVQVRDPKRFKVINTGVISFSGRFARFEIVYGSVASLLDCEKRNDINYACDLWIVGNVHKLDECEIPSAQVKRIMEGLESDHRSTIYVP